MSKKMIAGLLAVVLVLTTVIGGTLAYLSDKTEAVVNTFTVGNIDIDLTESTGDSYKMVPGNKYAKDPVVTVGADSEECWLFVKVEEENNDIANQQGEKYVQYAVNAEWKKLEGVDGVNNVWYKEKVAAGSTHYVLADNAAMNANGSVTINEKITQDDMPLTIDEYPTLTFTAYAVQSANIETVEAAWEQAKNAAEFSANA